MSQKDISDKNTTAKLSARDAAKVLSCAPDYIGKLCREGKLSGELINNVWHVDRASIDEYQKSRELQKSERSSKLANERRAQIREHKYATSGLVGRFLLRVNEHRGFAFGSLAVGVVLVVASTALAGVMTGYHFLPSSQSAALARVESPFFAGEVPSVSLGEIATGVSKFFASIFAPKQPTNQFVQSTVPVAQLTATTSAPVATATKPSTVVTNTYPVIERTVERVVTNTVSGVSQDAFDQALNALRSQIANISSGSSGVVLPYAPATRIDKLSGVAITGGTITSATISGGSISNVSLSTGDLSGIVAIANGGTGTSSAPSYGKVLLGNASGAYDLVATSSLGISGVSTFVGLSDTPSTITAGDIFYGNGSSALVALPIGTNGQVLKISGGVPTWGSDLQGAGGAGAWATTTDNLALYPADTTQVVIVGNNATTTTGNILEVTGSALFRSSLTAYNTITAPRFIATSTTLASTFAGGATFAGATSTASFAVTGSTTISSVLNIGGQLNANLSAILASTTLTGSSLFTNATTTSFAISNISSGNLLKTTTGGAIIAAVAGTDFENALTFTYPLSRSSNTVSLAFGTSTSNTWGGTQTFTNTPVLGTLSGLVGSNNGALYQIATSTNFVTSLAAGAGISLSGTAGAVTVTNTIGYPFVGNATTTTLTLSGGLLTPTTTIGVLNATSSATLASTTLSGNSLFTNATSTSFAISGIASGNILKTTTGGAIIAAVAGTDYTTFGYLFPSNATTTQLAFNGGATFAGATTTALAVTGSTTIQTLNLTNALGAAFGGTGSTTLTGLLVGNGTGALQTATISSPLALSGTTLSIQQATAAQNGYLSSTDWSTFNNKISSTSLSAGAGISYDSSTGVIANLIGYPFPSNATTTTLTLSGGLLTPTTTIGVLNATSSATLASTTLSGNTLLTNATTTNFFSTSARFTTASTTNLVISGLGSGSTQCLQINGSGTVSGTGSACGAGGSSFSYPFPDNATTTTLTLSGGLLTPTTTIGVLNATSSATLASTTLSGNSLFTNATTTNFAATNLSIGALSGILKATSGIVSAAVAGTDYTTPSGVASSIAAAFPFTATTNFGAAANSTSTPIWFVNGLQASSTSQFAYASTTALTVNGSLYGASLSACDANTQKLLWSNGTFSCGTDQNTGGGGGSFPFSADNNYGQVVYSTSTPTLWLKSGIFASSTSHFVNADFTSATTTNLAVTGVTSSLLKTLSSGAVVAAVAGTDYTTFGYLFPNNATTTFLNFGGGASTTQLSVFNRAYFGATGTTTIDSTGAITVTSNSANTLPYASSTALSVSGSLYTPVTSALLKTDSSGKLTAAVAGTDYQTFAWPFTPTTNFGAAANSTSTAAWFTNGVQASSTSHFAIADFSGVITSTATGANTLPYASTTALTVSGSFYGASLSTCNTGADKLLWNNGTFSCGTDAGASGTTEINWAFFNGSGVRVATSSNQVLIGFTSTSTNSKLEVVGGATFDSATTTALYASGITSLAGNVGLGTTTPYAKLSVVGGNVLQTASGNPTLATTVATTTTTHSYSSVVSGRYLYSADYEAGLRIIDISNPKTATSVGSYNTSLTHARGVAVAGKYAYVADDTAGLVILDVSNPASVQLVGSYAGINSFGIALSGRYVFIPDNSGGVMRILDVSDPTSPRLVSSLQPNVASQPLAVVVQGKFAYLGDNGTSRVYAIDISNPASPSIAGSYVGNSPTGLYVSGKYLYVADNGGGLYILNIATSNGTPTLVGTLNGTAQYYGVQVAGDYAYIADRAGNLVVADVSNPASPTSVGTLAVGDQPNGVTVVGKYAYVAANGNSTKVVDINGTKLPAASIGTIESNTANVSDTLTVGGDASFGGGIDVGISGILSRGTIAAYVASSTQTNPTVASFIGGNVGIGTTSPYAALSVAGQSVFNYITATGTAASSFAGGVNLNGGATSTAFAVTGSTTISSILNIGGQLNANLSAILASTTLTGSSLFTNATTTSFAISNISSGSILKTTTGGAIIAAVAGTDYVTGAGLTAAFPFTATTNFGVTANSTSTLAWFKGSPVSLAASSTAWFDQINVGSTTSGTLATSTFYGNLVTQGSLQVGTSSSRGFTVFTTAATGNGLAVTTTGAGSGVTLQTVSDTTDEALAISTKGTGVLNLNVGSSIVQQLSSTGIIFSSSAKTSGSTAQFRFNGSANTGLTGSTEANDVWFNLGQTKTHSNGTIATQRSILIDAPSEAFTSYATSNRFIDLATLGISGAPITPANGNGTTTNAYTILLGASALNSSTTNSYGIAVNANTGATNNYAAEFLGGNVGIGTTSPFANLAIHNLASSTNTVLLAIGSTTNIAGTFSTSTLFSVSNTGAISGLNLSLTGGATSTALAVTGSTTISSVLNIGGQLNANLSAVLASTTLSGNSLFTNATTTSFAISGISSGSILKTTTGGAIIAAVAGTDFVTGAGLTAAFPFTATTNFGAAANSTSTAIWFQSGLQASSTAQLANINTYGILNFATTSSNASSTLASFQGQTFLTASTTGFNTGLGLNALANITKGDSNTAFGYQSLLNATTTSRNVAVGYQALLGNSGTFTATQNTAVGYQALTAATTGGFNTAVGYISLLANTSGTFNTALGWGALSSNETGTQNVGVGYNALSSATGQFNTSLGSQALSNVSSGNDNVGVGKEAGVNLTTGSQNVLLGLLAGRNLTSGSNNIILGYNTLATSSSATNSLNIGNFIFGTLPATTSANALAIPTTGSLGLGTSSPFAKFSIASNNGDTATTLFAIGSSTASATSTLFSISNTGRLSVGTSSVSELTFNPLNGTISVAAGSGNSLTFGSDGIFTVNGSSRSLTFNSGTGAFDLTGSVNTLNFNGNTSSGNVLDVTGFLKVSAAGFGTTTLTGLTVNGSATSTSNVGFNITAGCYAVGGTCLPNNAALAAAFPFTANTWGNSTSTVIGFTNGIFSNASSTFAILQAASTTLTGNSLFTNATTTSFAISGIASDSILKTTTGGAIIAAVAGTDYVTGAGLASAYPFQVSGNATSTLTQFNGGLTAFASSTIGNGTQDGGLTISGGATTTGTFTLGSVINFTGGQSTTTLLSILNTTYFAASSTNRSVYLGPGAGVTSLRSGATGLDNFGVGSGALAANTTGDNNIAIGSSALIVNTTGGSNNALGFETLDLNTSGTDNNAIGYRALSGNTSGTNNNAIGYQALAVNSTGSYNNAIGISPLLANTTGTGNNAFGYLALRSNTTGKNNIGLGYQAGYNVTTGYSNIMVGDNTETAGSITTGSGNISLGSNVFFASTTANRQLNIGNILFGTLPATSTVFAEATAGTLGVATSSPFAKFSIHANASSTNQTLFAIGSTTLVGGNTYATTTLFSISNKGQLVIGQDASPVSTSTQFTLLAGTTTAARVSANSLNLTGTAIAVQGRYAYIADGGGQTNAFEVWDISNAASSTRVGQASLVASTAGYGIVVQGRYAYVTGDLGLDIFDVSNPASPKSISTKSLNNFFAHPYIQGRYLYIVGEGTTNALEIWDVANPSAPVRVGQGTLNQTGEAIYVQGKYAYLADRGATTNAFEIWDVSNPTSPFRVSASSTNQNGNAIFVQGNYAYLVDETATNGFEVWNVSNPAAPWRVSSNTLSGAGNDVFVQGNYAYVMVGTALEIWSIANPAAPTRVALYATIGGAGAISVQGRYAYSVNTTVASSGFQIWDLGGAYIQQGEFGGLETGTLSVRNALSAVDGTFSGGLSAGGSLNVTGSGSFVSATSTYNTTTNIFNITTASSTNSIFSVLGNNNVGIGTTTPWARLSVDTSTLASGVPSLIIGSSTRTDLVVTQGGAVGVGTSSPFAKFSIFAGGDYTAQAASTLFAIGSTTAGTATTTLFSISSTGTTTLGRFGSCNTTSALTTDASGNIICGAITAAGDGVGSWFTATTFGATAANATSTLTGFTNGIYALASSTIGGGSQTTGLTISGGATTTGNAYIAGLLTVLGGTSLQGATSTSFAISGIASDSILKTTTGGAIIAAVAGTDYVTGAGLASAYPFQVSGNATSTLTQFNGGLTAFASSTIGAGGQTTGLTVSGGATTTGNAYFEGNVSLASTSPFAKFAIHANASSTSQTLFAIGSTTLTGSTFSTSTLFSISNTGLATINNLINFTGGQSTTTLLSISSMPYFAASTTNSSIYLGPGAGVASLRSGATGLGNFGVGQDALRANTGGDYNNAVGFQTLISNTSGSYNNATGYGALQTNVSGTYNNALGYAALVLNNSGIHNNAIGYFALSDNTSGGYNNALGYEALNLNTTGSYNSAIGYRAGYNITTGYSNTLIGDNTETTGSITTGGGNIGLGSNIFFPSATANSQLNIGNLLFGTMPATSTAFRLPTSGSLGVGTSSPFAKFAIQTNNGDTATTLFAIGSSTASATTTLFSVDNTGSTTIANGINITAGCFAIGGTCLQSASFTYPFPNAATSTLLTFSGGLLSTASTTIGAGGQTTGLTISGGATTTGSFVVTGAYASTTKFYANGLTTCQGGSVLTYDGAGTFGCATDQTAAGGWPFTPTTFGSTAANATSTLIGFTQGIYALASSTIGNGTQTGGLTISGGATTTATSTLAGLLVTSGNVGIGTLTPTYMLDVTGTAHVTGNVTFDGTLTVGGALGGISLNSGGAGTAAISVTSNGTVTLNSSDTVTGMFKYTFGGTESARLQANGNFGLGTTSPYAKLAVFAGGDYLAAAPSTLFAIGSTTAGTATTTLFSILSSGNVGIGTSSPGSRLSLTQAASVSQFTLAYDSSNATYMRTDSVGDLWIVPSGNDARFTNGNLWVCTGGSITSNACPSGAPSGQGNLIVQTAAGIGTSTPSSALTVYSTSANAAIFGDNTAAVALGQGTSEATIQGYTTTSGTTAANLNLQPGGSFVGIATTSPWGLFSINPVATNGTAPSFVIGSSTGTRFIVTNAGNVGVGTTSPVQQLSVGGKLFVGNGAPTGMGTATSTFQGDVLITGKLDVSTIDPVYTIDGVKYATYGLSSVGIKEETSATITLAEKNAAGKYEYAINFSEVEKGSDLWLFYQVTTFGEGWKDLVANLTPGFDGSVHYVKDPATNTLRIVGDAPGEVSVRLVSSRFDAHAWPNLRPDQNSGFSGFQIQSKP